MWHVSSRSGVATLRTAIHLLLTYLLFDRQTAADLAGEEDDDNANEHNTDLQLIALNYVSSHTGRTSRFP